MKCKTLILCMVFISMLNAQECSFLDDGACLNDDEQVEVFKSYGRVDKTNQDVLFNFRGWVYEPYTGSKRRDSFIALLQQQTGNSLSKIENVSLRVDPFLVDNQSDELLRVRIGDDIYSLNASLSSGQFSGDIRIPYTQVKKIMTVDNKIIYTLLADTKNNKGIVGQLDVIADKGVMVISDVDDTVKVSEVYVSKERLLENVFLNSQKPIIQVRSILKELQKKTPSTHFFYVSGSPKQLHQNITVFLKKHEFPAGPIYLKDFQSTPFSTSFFNFFDDNATFKHKVETISKLIEDFPEKEVVLVGDSGEKDPEIYAMLLQKFPKQIEKVYLHNVTSETLDNVRLQKAFASAIHKVVLVESKNVVTNKSDLKPFTSDGCSLFPDGTIHEKKLWLDCCTQHDIAYWQGGSREKKQQADEALRVCVASLGKKTTAKLMKIGVILGGDAYYPTSYRWGYGWPYLRGYKSLTTQEHKAVKKELKRYYK